MDVNGVSVFFPRLVSEHILERAKRQENREDDLLSIDQLRKFVDVAKTVNPVMSEEAKSLLTAFFVKQRNQGNRCLERTSNRLLLGLMKVSQGQSDRCKQQNGQLDMLHLFSAHARLMCRSQVTKSDAVVAICLQDCSQGEGCLFGETDVFRSVSPVDPEEDQRQTGVARSRQVQ